MSRFVSAGTTDDSSPPQNSALLAPQSATEIAPQQPKPKAANDDGKSLYETLQANKAAKQEAFESAARLSNQFQTLDEDEVEFLDSVLQEERAREAEVRRRTAEEVEGFRRLQQEGMGRGVQGSGMEGEREEWKVGGGRKRKRGGGGAIGGVKVRRTSTAEREKTGQSSGEKQDVPPATSTTKGVEGEVQFAKELPKTAVPANPAPQQSTTASSPITPPPAPRPADGGGTTNLPSSPPPPTALGLAAYSSDSDDDD